MNEIELNNKYDIKAWLKKYNIKNYTIHEDLTVDINTDVYLFDMGLKNIPIKFNHVKGDFICSNNELVSLKNTPKIVGGNFNCAGNSLISLEDCPHTVGMDFMCHVNQLTSLKFSPNIVNGHFSCNDNNLTSLEYGPKIVTADFNCSYNYLTTLEHTPEKIGRRFSCQGNKLTSLEYFPQSVGVKVFCSLNIGLGDFQYTTDFEVLHREHVRLQTIKKEKALLNDLLSVEPVNDNKESFKI